MIAISTDKNSNRGCNAIWNCVKLEQFFFMFFLAVPLPVRYRVMMMFILEIGGSFRNNEKAEKLLKIEMECGWVCWGKESRHVERREEIFMFSLLANLCKNI